LVDILADPDGHAYLREFVAKVIERKLWQYSEAHNAFNTYISEIDITSILKDTNTLYKDLNGYYLELSKKYNIKPQLSLERGQVRAKSIDKHILQKADKFPQINTYLDIGCFDGAITQAIGMHFKLDTCNIHGVDIKLYDSTDSADAAESNKYNNITFNEYDGKQLPFEDGSFELVTCLMTLHHIDPLNLPTLISEIMRVLAPGGVVIIREHDTQTHSQEAVALDLMHDFYDYVWATDNNYVWEDSHRKNNYKTHETWAQLFHTVGMVSHVNPAVFHNFDHNPYNTYMCSYEKPLLEKN
jgi:ubiquinone/menaquinone biosynthesis C-methylase UbiE